MPRLVTLDEAAKQLGVSIAAVRDWRFQRKHLDFVKVGRAVRVLQNSIDQANRASDGTGTGGAVVSPAECHPMSEILHRRCCVHCRQEIPLARLRRGKYFCSTECHRADRIERRRFQASFNCRLCGRPKRAKQSKSDLVRSAHTQVDGISS